MANPWRPFSRAAAMFSSGLETPSPEKKVWVWRSMLKGIGGRLIWAARNAKCRFQGMGPRLRSVGPRRTSQEQATLVEKFGGLLLSSADQIDYSYPRRQWARQKGPQTQKTTPRRHKP